MTSAPPLSLSGSPWSSSSSSSSSSASCSVPSSNVTGILPDVYILHHSGFILLINIFQKNESRGAGPVWLHDLAVPALASKASFVVVVVVVVTFVTIIYVSLSSSPSPSHHIKCDMFQIKYNIQMMRNLWFLLVFVTTIHVVLSIDIKDMFNQVNNSDNFQL